MSRTSMDACRSRARWLSIGAAVAIAGLAPAMSASAQGLPGWAEETLGMQSGRYRAQSLEDRRNAAQPDVQAGGAQVRAPYTDPTNGGARPQISPAAPPTVAFNGNFAPNSIVIDSGARVLYYVLPGRRAYMYRIAVGREGFSWYGSESVSRKQSWPDWHPPAEMRQRDPRLPVKMTGGVRNPLGATALYLGNTLYRIHGTNDERSIGRAGSSGCFRMMNASVVHLASITPVGTRVHVVRRLPANVATATS
jgi:lipoprotein-anchoring transpeptidase ErfK/SrfK